MSRQRSIIEHFTPVQQLHMVIEDSEFSKKCTDEKLKRMPTIVQISMACIIVLSVLTMILQPLVDEQVSSSGSGSGSSSSSAGGSCGSVTREGAWHIIDFIF